MWTERRCKQRLYARSLSLLFRGAFSEVNFTTEAAQYHGRRDCGPAHGTPEGTALFDDEPGECLGLEGYIIVDFTLE